MTTFEFMFTTKQPFTDEEHEKLQLSGLLDRCLTGSGPDGVGEIDVEWEAETYEAAIEAATAALKAVIPAMEVVHVTPVA